MKNLRYAASVVVVLASMVFVGCGIGDNATDENGAVEKAAPGNDAAGDAGGGLTLENSILSVPVPNGWTSVSNPFPESMLSMVASTNAHRSASMIVIISFAPKIGKTDREFFDIIKGVHERRGNIDSERMQKVAGRDALRLEMTKTDDDGKVTRAIVVTILLDDSTVTIRSGGSSSAMDAARDQIDEITDSIKFK